MLMGIAIGSEITFAIVRRADCNATQGGSFDSTYVTFSGGCTNLNFTNPTSPNAKNYNIYSPSLTLKPAPAITNALIGNTYTRIDSIINGGENSAIDTVRFFIVYPGAAVQNTSGGAVVANGTSFSPYKTNGDTLFYKFYGATLFGGNNILENGEKIAVQEPIIVKKCGSPTIYGVTYKRSESATQTGCNITTGTSTITMKNGVAIITPSFKLNPGVGPCVNGKIELTFKNTASDTSKAGAAYNIRTLIGHTANGNSSVYLVNPTTVSSGLKFITRIDLMGGPTSLAYTFPTMPSGEGTPLQIDFSQFTVDPDGPGGLSDLDGDGQFDDLRPGDSITLVLNDSIPCDLISCPRNLAYRANNARWIYTNMCQVESKTNDLYGSSEVDYTGVNSSFNSRFPGVVNDGDVFTISYCQQGGHRPSLTTSVDSVYYQVVLPPGVTPATALNFARYNSVTIPNADAMYKPGSGGNPDTVLIRRKQGLGCVDIDLKFTCGTGGNLAFQSEVYYINDRLCPCSKFKRFCSQDTVIGICSGVSCLTGMAIGPPSVQRNSFGWTDTTMSTKVLGSAVTDYYAKRTLLPKDSIKVRQYAIQKGSYDNMYYEFAINSMDGVHKSVSYLGGTIYYTKKSSGITTAYTLPAPTNTATSPNQVLRFNLTSTLSLSPGNKTQDGDSVYIDLNLLAEYSGESVYVPTKYGNLHSGFYNLDAGSKMQCGLDLFDLYYSYGLERFYIGPASFVACGSSEQSAWINYNHGVSRDIYPNEFRPLIKVDTIRMVLPTGYEFDPAGNLRYVVSRYVTEFATANYTFIPSYSLQGNLLKMFNFTKLSDYTGQRAFNLYIPIKPNCQTPIGETVIDQNWLDSALITKYYYSYYQKDTSMRLEVYTYYTYGSTSKPALNVANNTGTVQGVLPTHYWDVTINNPTINTAPYVFMKLEKFSTSGIWIDSVKNRVGTTIGTIVPVTANYGSQGNKWYKLDSAGIAGGASKQYRIYFHFTGCHADSLQMSAGWNCAGYPVDAGSYQCNTTIANTWLKVEPQPSELQLSVSRQPGGAGTVDMCTTDSLQVVINSSQAANLIDPRIFFKKIEGLDLEDSVNVEFPVGSGNIQKLKLYDDGISSDYVILSEHSGIGSNGMPGVYTSPSPISTRQAEITLLFKPNCSFVSGRSIDFSSTGKRPCGANATGYGTRVTTDAIDITGATALGSAGFSFSLSSTATCQSLVTISTDITPTSEDSKNGDSLVFTLPDGLRFYSSPDPVVLSGNQVKIDMPSIPSGTTFTWSFDCIASGQGCGKLPIEVEYQRKVEGLICGIDTCPNASIIIARGTTDSISFLKPDIRFDSVSSAKNFIPGGTYKSKFYLSNISSEAAYASQYLVEAFCGESVTPFDSSYFTASIPAYGSASDSLEFTLPFEDTCLSGEYVSYRISAVTNTSASQCLCNDASYRFSSPLPVELVSFDAYKSEDVVQLKWVTASERNNEGFEVQRSSDGINWYQIDYVYSKSSSGNSVVRLEYSITDEQPISGYNYYRLKQNDLDGKFEYSPIRVVDMNIQNEISVYPNVTSNYVNIIGLSRGQNIQLFNSLGQIVETKLVANQTEVIDLSTLKPALYMLVVTDGQGILISNFKVVKQN